MTAPSSASVTRMRFYSLPENLIRQRNPVCPALLFPVCPCLALVFISLIAVVIQSTWPRRNTTSPTQITPSNDSYDSANMLSASFWRTLEGRRATVYALITSVAFIAGLWISPSLPSSLSTGQFSSAFLHAQGEETVLSLEDTLTRVLGPYTPQSGDGFTILTPSFKREHLLFDFFERYATGEIPSLRQIILQWVEGGTKPSQKLLQSLKDHPVPIWIVRPKGDSLNERFRLPEGLDGWEVLFNNTRTFHSGIDAVLSLDDDLLLEASDVELSYQAWRDFGGAERRRMLGFYEREVTQDLVYEWHDLATYR